MKVNKNCKKTTMNQLCSYIVLSVRQPNPTTCQEENLKTATTDRRDCYSINHVYLTFGPDSPFQVLVSFRPSIWCLGREQITIFPLTRYFFGVTNRAFRSKKDGHTARTKQDGAKHDEL